MPRAKPFDGWEGSWIVPPFRPKPGPETREALDTILRSAGLAPGTKPARAFLSAVREALAEYAGAQPVIDRSPRPANQRAALHRIDDGEPNSRTPLPALKRAIDQLDSRTREALQGVPPDGFDLATLRRLLDGLDRAITIVDQRLERADDSRGSDPQEARRLVLLLVARAYQEATTIDEPSEYLEALQECLESSCTLAGIDLPRSDRLLDLLPPSVKVPRKTP